MHNKILIYTSVQIPKVQFHTSLPKNYYYYCFKVEKFLHFEYYLYVLLLNFLKV